MKTWIASVVLLLLGTVASATPDRSIWVIDELVGFRSGSYVIRQYVMDNEGSHYSSHLEAYVVEKAITTNQVISIDRIAFMQYSSDKPRVGRSEDGLEGLLKQKPYLFHDMDYAMPIGTLDSGKDSLYLKDSTIEYMSEGKGTAIDLWKWIPQSLRGNVIKRIVQTYEHGDYYFFLIEMVGNDFYQKIIPIPVSEFVTQK
jgi:hypothetical protein